MIYFVMTTWKMTIVCLSFTRETAYAICLSNHYLEINIFYKFDVCLGFGAPWPFYLLIVDNLE